MQLTTAEQRHSIDDPTSLGRYDGEVAKAFLAKVIGAGLQIEEQGAEADKGLRRVSAPQRTHTRGRTFFKRKTS
jgi:hypothetical protein